MQLDDISHFKTASGNSQRIILCPLELAPASVRKCLRPDWAAVAEYRAANCLVGR